MSLTTKREPQGFFSCGGIRRWRRYPHLPLTSKLDASSWGMRTPFCYAEMEFSSATSTKKREREPQGFSFVEVFAVGEDTLTCRLQASLTHLRGVCALLSAAQKWSFHQPHQRKKRKRTTRVLFLFFGRSVEIRTPGLQFPNKYAIVF